MKSGIHPHYNPNAKIICDSCKTTWTAGSTLDEVHVEVCSTCHPFYTGEVGALVDTDNRVDRFLKQQAAAEDDVVIIKKKKKAAKRGNKTGNFNPEPTVTLKDMMKSIQK